MSSYDNAVDRLDAEWPAVCADPRAAQWVSGWLADAGVIEAEQGPVALAEVLPLLGRRDRELGRVHSDRWMAAVLEHAAGQGPQAQLAARFVVQAMLPGAVVTARRMRAFGHSRSEVVHTVVTALYEVVRLYPLDRRPTKIAANILLDTLRTAHRELRRDSYDTARAEPLGEQLVCADPGPGPGRVAELRGLAAAARASGVPGLAAAAAEDLDGSCGQVVELLLWALERRVLDRSAVEAVHAYYRPESPSDEDAARQAGVTPAAWRQRRSRAVRRLRQVCEPAAALAA